MGASLERMATIVDLVYRAGERPETRDLHTWDSTRDVLAEELRALESPVVALEADGRGVLILDVAADKGRAWAWGPAVDGDDDREARADALLDDALRRLPPEVTRISAYPHLDAWMVGWWRARGATLDAIVHVYRAERPPGSSAAADGGSGDSGVGGVGAGRAESGGEVRVREVVAGDLAALTRLHDAAFPRTYLSATELLAGAEGRRTLGADVDSGLVGYVCAESQRDGTGYIHYLAVDAAHRRRGLGRALLQAALAWLYDECGLPEVFLTVSDSNDARHLYGQVGFGRLSSGQTIDLFLPSAPRTRGREAGGEETRE